MGTSRNRSWLYAAILMAMIGIMIAIFGFIRKSEAGEITWHQLNKVTVAWDAVTTLSDDTPIPEGDIVKYKVYVAEPGQKENAFHMGETEAVEYEFGLPKEGKFFAGVQALRYRLIDEDLKELGRSRIAWSDMDEDTGNNPFGIVFYFTPSAPLNLRKKEIPL